jgi:aspartyl-tRNA(Asn)/glutamyl-tRNA(Gln) amidotransferase subunit C
MSHITKKDIEKISRLAKIEIAEDDFEYYAKQLTNITGWIETLKEVDTSDIEPMVSVFDEPLRMEKDEVSDGEIADDILQNSKTAKYNYFTVPKVIE